MAPTAGPIAAEQAECRSHQDLAHRQRPVRNGDAAQHDRHHHSRAVQQLGPAQSQPRTPQSGAFLDEDLVHLHQVWAVDERASMAGFFRRFGHT